MLIVKMVPVMMTMIVGMVTKIMVMMIFMVIFMMMMMIYVNMLDMMVKQGTFIYSDLKVTHVSIVQISCN